MVAQPADKSGGIGHKLEQTQGLEFTASITGGDAHTRRYRNDYSKIKHAEEDKARLVADHEFPDLSPNYIIGGIRSGSL